MPAPTILDATGLPMPRASAFGPTTSHSAADRVSQDLANWQPALRSADADWLPERDTVVSRVRDLARNNGWASGAMQRFVDQAIGANFRLSYRPSYAALGQTADWARAFRREVEEKFMAWANDPRCYVDAAERMTISGLVGLCFRHRLVEGESLAVAQWLRRAGTSFATAIQVVDPDRLSNPNNVPDTVSLKGGVEINAYGAPQAYHIRAHHPADSGLASMDSMRWERIPRRTPWGRTRVIHFFEAERADQTRGKSILTPVVEKFRMEDRYGRTELQAALVNAIFAAFIESPFDHSLLEEALDTGVSAYQTARADFHNDRRLTLDGVRIPTLFPGESFKFSAAERPNASFAEFERAVLRHIAAGIGQSYEQVAGDWSQTNYSSARAALLEAWKFLIARRDSYAAGVATPIFVLWLEEAIDNGTVEVPAGAPAFWDNVAAWTRCRWIGPGRGWVDPTKEAQAALMRIDAGLSTLQDEAAEQGKDYEEILEQQAYERARRRELGLPDPDVAGIQQTPVAAEPEEEKRPAGGNNGGR
ncbi:phage portal protein [Shumkonia mesophila]|uniref:phage portal protein n=1 Tax=Shumkonia mesophila TaxID=2838854 RepID=UPI0029341122|nr:phage portal protein [Shumkonia mesophila]